MTFPDFEEFIAFLNAHRVRYLIVGGYAVGFHARPRATKDIDILIDVSDTNAKRARKAIVDFLGTDAPNITEEKLMNPRTLIVLGVEPIRVDILTAIDGLKSFSAAWKRRVKGKYGSISANYIALDDLIIAKKAAGRPQDLADVEVLLKVAKKARKTQPDR